MHANFFGDNKDHGKGFVLSSLFAKMDSTWAIQVDPMLSDRAWDSIDDGGKIRAYRRFLRLANYCPLINETKRYEGLTKVIRNGKKECYFEPHFNHTFDIFFDANTGIGKGGADYLPKQILPKLIPVASPRVVLVFQSRHRLKTKADFEIKVISDISVYDLDSFLCFLGQDTYIVFVGEKGNQRLADFKAIMNSAFHPFQSMRIWP